MELKHLLYHVTPIGNFRWNLDQLRKRWGVFTGKKFIAVAQGKGLLHIRYVKELLPPDCEVFAVENNTDIRETASFPVLLKKLHEVANLSGITFYGHTKGVSHGETDSTIKLWTSALYYFNLDRMDLVERVLREYKVAGALVRYGEFAGFPRESRWHYAGTFFWFKNLELFSRNWKKILPTRYGVEGYLSTLFSEDEAGIIFGNKIGDPYNYDVLQRLLGPHIKNIRLKCYVDSVNTLLPQIDTSFKNNKKISVVITTHGKAEDIGVMLNCLRNQFEFIPKADSRDPSSEVLWGKGKPYKHPLEIIVSCDGRYEGGIFPTAVDSLIECPKEGGVGHHTRNPGINAATGDWIILTNSDNYFVQGTFYLLSKHFRENVGLIYYNCINNLWQYGDNGGVMLRRGMIDLSCVCVRSFIAKKIGFPYRNYDGDWDYIYDCAQESRSRNLEIVKLPYTLSVHN